MNRKNKAPKSSDEGEEDGGGEKKRSYQWRRKVVSAGGEYRDSEDRRIRRVSENLEDKNAEVLKKVEGRGSFYIDHTRLIQRPRLRQHYMILRLQFKDSIWRQYYDGSGGSFIKDGMWTVSLIKC